MSDIERQDSILRAALRRVRENMPVYSHGIASSIDSLLFNQSVSEQQNAAMRDCCVMILKIMPFHSASEVPLREQLEKAIGSAA
jgi:hypothetical protein